MSDSYMIPLRDEQENGMGDEVMEPIVIKPKLRYLFVQAFVPIIIYMVAILLWLFLPWRNFWIHYGLMVLPFVCCLCMVYSLFSIICTQWVITGEDICYRRGVFARREDYLELYRIRDYVYRETFLERILGLCSFFILSSDVTTSVLRIYGIPRMRALQEELRRRVEIQRKIKRIYEIGNQ